MVPCSRFIWIINSSDHKRVCTANLLHAMSLPNPLDHMQDIRSSNPPVVTGICDPNKSRARYHRSLKLGSKLKYLNYLPQILVGPFLNTLSHFTYIVKFLIIWETEPIYCIQFCISPLPELL